MTDCQQLEWSLDTLGDRLKNASDQLAKADKADDAKQALALSEKAKSLSTRFAELNAELQAEGEAERKLITADLSRRLRAALGEVGPLVNRVSDLFNAQSKKIAEPVIEANNHCALETLACLSKLDELRLEVGAPEIVESIDRTGGKLDDRIRGASEDVSTAVAEGAQNLGGTLREGRQLVERAGDDLFRRLDAIADSVASFPTAPEAAPVVREAEPGVDRRAQRVFTNLLGMTLPSGETPTEFAVNLKDALNRRVTPTEAGGYEVQLVRGEALPAGGIEVIGGQKLFVRVATTYLDDAQNLLSEFKRPVRLAPDLITIEERRERVARAAARFIAAAETEGGPITARLNQAVRNFEVEVNGLLRVLGIEDLERGQDGDLRELDIGEAAEALAVAESVRSYIASLRFLIQEFTQDDARERGIGPVRFAQTMQSLGENLNQLEHASDLAEFGRSDRESRRLRIPPSDEIRRIVAEIRGGEATAGAGAEREGHFRRCLRRLCERYDDPVRDALDRLSDGLEDFSIQSLIAWARDFQEGALAILSSGDAKLSDVRIWAETACQIRIYFAWTADLLSDPDAPVIRIGRARVLRALDEIDGNLGRIAVDSSDLVYRRRPGQQAQSA
ncbi:MAG: hypothetical protein QNJ92_12685 [Alphaproteobacteria bacterium]|nr:hypothetical protein [Alphaproteobacteria bacterium]